MKTKILIFLVLFLATSAMKANASRNDTVWTSYHYKGYNVKVLGGDLHYYMKSKVHIEADDQSKKIIVKFDYGKVEKINKNWYYITPNLIGICTIQVNDISYPLQVFPIPEPKVSLDGDEYKWSGVITKEALLNTTKLVVKNKYTNFGLISYTITFYKNGDLIEANSRDSVFPKNILKDLKELEVGNKLYIENIIVKDPDGSTRLAQYQTYKIIDSYNNEFIRNTVMFKPYTYDLNIMHYDLRIKIEGHPTAKDIKLITDFANELNGILFYSKVKIVEKQPSLTIVFDTIKNDSDLIKKGYEKILCGYKISNRYLFYPNKIKYKMYHY